MSDEQTNHEREWLRKLIVDHELQRFAIDLVRQVHDDVLALKRQTDGQPRLSQVRSLANVLTPAGYGDHPQQRLGRLHELAASQLQRRGKQPPPAIRRLDAQGLRSEKAADRFWLYVAGRLAGLRSGDHEGAGDIEDLWKRLKTRYPDLWPEEQPDAELLMKLHLRLAEMVIYNLIETWEYTYEEAAA